jgi:hypothetical protein
MKLDHPSDHPPPEKERRGLGRPSHFPGDFLNDQTLTKYKPARQKSILPASGPTLIHFVCIQENSSEGQRFGVFHEIHAVASDDRWIVAKIPASWKTARSTQLAVPPPDGNRVEKPASLLRPFNSKDEALKTFERWSNHSPSLGH